MCNAIRPNVITLVSREYLTLCCHSTMFDKFVLTLLRKQSHRKKRSVHGYQKWMGGEGGFG